MTTPIRKIERVYSDDGNELTANGVGAAISNPNQFLYDGRYMWVAADSGIYIYEFWGASSNHEPTWEELDELLYPRYDSGAEKKLKLITFITLTGTQVRRVTRYPSLSLRPDILPTTPDGAVTVGSATVTLTTKSSVLRVITEVWSTTSGTFTPASMARIGDDIFVANSTFTQIFRFDVQTQRPVEVINLPIRTGTTSEVGNSNLCASGGKLWFINQFFDDNTPQKLYRYTPGAGTMTGVSIPVRPATTRQILADGLNGFVYMTNFNNVSVSKFDNATGAYVSTIRVNAFPQQMWVDQNRRIFVNSYAGMLSLVDWDDDQVHNSYSTGLNTQAIGFATDPTDATRVWWVDTAKLVRYNLNNLQQIESYVSGDVEDWKFKGSQGGTTGFPAGFKTMTITPQIAYDKEDLSPVTVRPYVFIGHNGHISCFRLDTRLFYLPSYFEVNGQGAVTAGSLEYFGEV